ncbi:MAG: ABC transporter [Coleofasciculaceae cyanobacterium RL_1_1]|nr:ABC transporter [Coleofasciculaceae cyanobacterium RL_1_1]
MKKRLTQLKQYWIFLLWIGLFLLIAGSTAGLLTGEWMTTPTLMIIFGTTSLSIWATGQDRVARGFWSRRSTEIGTNAIISTLAVIGILAAINVLGARYSQRLDLTEAKQFTLAPESIAIVANLDAPVKIWIFSYQANPADQALLDNYRRASDGQISYEYVDPQAKPGMVQEFGVTADGEVFLEANDSRQFVQTIGLDGLSETQLSNRIAQLGAGAASKIYFLQGHGERSVSDGQQDGMARAMKALEEKNFEVEPLTLTSAASGSMIPQDAAVLAIISPATALFENEVAAISDYLAAGGRVLLTVDPNTEPKLDEFAASWGVELGKGIAIDPERWVQGLGPAAPLAIDYGQHPITQDFGQNFSLFPVVKPLRLTDAEDITAQPLVFTSDASWEEMNLDQGPDWTLDAPEDQPGPLILAVALSKPVESAAAASAIDSETDETETAETETAEPLNESEPIAAEETPAEETATEPTEETTTPAESTETDSTETDATQEEPNTTEDQNPEAPEIEARLVMFGDSDFLTDSFFDNQLNGDLFLNAIGWLAEVDETQLSIRSKESTERSLTLTPPVARFLAWTALATFPAIGLGASAILWWKRR